MKNTFAVFFKAFFLYFSSPDIRNIAIITAKLNEERIKNVRFIRFMPLSKGYMLNKSGVNTEIVQEPLTETAITPDISIYYYSFGCILVLYLNVTQV